MGTEFQNTGGRPTTLHGRLSGDAVEGGGLFLLGRDGSRAELVLPRGWRRTETTTGVQDASGTQVAALADDVRVDGSFSEVIASIRQQGRMFLVASMTRQSLSESIPD